MIAMPHTNTVTVHQEYSGLAGIPDILLIVSDVCIATQNEENLLLNRRLLMTGCASVY
jgi:hypothetical protein